MAVTKTLIKATAMQKLDPDEILYRVNRELSRDNDVAMFVTIFCGILNTETGEIVYANGGHNLPVVVKRSPEAYYLEKSGGIAIGAMEGVTYQKESLLLEPGDMLFLYTDGVTEAMNGKGAFFSEDRLQIAVNNLKGKSPRETIAGVLRVMAEFTSGAPQSDDITMTAIQFFGRKAGSN
jgi:sigma-B regulation protein RsbU (phosphoserine phosphatase)